MYSSLSTQYTNLNTLYTKLDVKYQALVTSMTGKDYDSLEESYEDL